MAAHGCSRMRSLAASWRRLIASAYRVIHKVPVGSIKCLNVRIEANRLLPYKPPKPIEDL